MTIGIHSILTSVEAECRERRERDGGVMLMRNDTDRIAEITKHLGDMWAGSDFRVQMVKVAAAAIDAIEQYDIVHAQESAFKASVVD